MSFPHAPPAGASMRRSSSTIGPPGLRQAAADQLDAARAAPRCGRDCSGPAARPCAAARARPTARRPPAPAPLAGGAPGQHVAVVVAVDDELGAVPRQHLLEGGGILKPARAAGLARQRRMVDQHQAEQPGPAQALQHAAEPLALLAPRPAPGDQRRRGTAELTPISATGPSMRTKGKRVAVTGMRGPCAHGGHVGRPARGAGIAPRSRDRCRGCRG